MVKKCKKTSFCDKILSYFNNFIQKFIKRLIFSSGFSYPIHATMLRQTDSLWPKV